MSVKRRIIWVAILFSIVISACKQQECQQLKDTSKSSLILKDGKIVSLYGPLIDIKEEEESHEWLKDLLPSDKTYVDKMKEKYAEEIASADYVHNDKNILATVTQKTYQGQTYFLSHIIINSASQIKGGLSYDSYGGARETPNSFANRNNAILAINGSVFYYETGRPMEGVIIKNSEVMFDSLSSSHAKHFEVCIDNNGKLFEAPIGISDKELLNLGVKDTIITGDPVFIENSEKLSCKEVMMGMYMMVICLLNEHLLVW